MKKTLLSLFPVMFMLGVWQAHADEVWMANRTIEPGETIDRADVDLKDVKNPSRDALGSTASPVGMDARRRIIANRPMLDRDVEAHVLVRANAPVEVIWQSGAISMQLQARALQQGAVGDTIRVLNTSSSHVLMGTVLPDGSVQVGN